MRLRKLGLIAVLTLSSLLFCTQLSSAQDAKQGKKRGGLAAQQRVDQMATRLDLNADQKAKLVTVFENETKKVRELRNDQNTPREQQRDKVRAIREETQKEVKAILTPAQWEKWQKAREEFRPRAGERKNVEKKKAEQQ